MVIRDHMGCFIEGRTVTLQNPADVFKAETIGVREALAWVLSREERRVTIETDSKLTVEAIMGKRKCMLEVGHIIDQCPVMLQLLPKVSVKYVHKQANKVAHGLARISCIINCSIVFASAPTHLVETCLIDTS